MIPDQQHMQYCLRLARQARASGDAPVGSVVVLEGQVIGEGVESGKSSGDVTRHAEILAIRDALSRGYGGELSASILYSTHEPCWMCSYPIRHYRIPVVIFGLEVPTVGGYSSAYPILTTGEVPTWGRAPRIMAGFMEEACRLLHD